jgi:hypothetical protein
MGTQFLHFLTGKVAPGPIIYLKANLSLQA